MLRILGDNRVKGRTRTPETKLKIVFMKVAAFLGLSTASERQVGDTVIARQLWDYLGCLRTRESLMIDREWRIV